MAELELVTLHEDAERLVLRGPDGAEHTLAISEALRAAVRRDRPRTEALQAQSEASLRPREVQARLRAGATAEDLAAESGLPLENVRRYEWPVIAERDHVLARVRDHHVDGEGKVVLGELADARLAARGVPEKEAVWTARRKGSGPWQVEVRFTAGERERSACWSFDPKGRVVTALDDEARWLGQPDDPVSPEILGVPNGGARRNRPAPPSDEDADRTDLLLDDLAGRRGQRPTQRPRRPAPGQPPDELPLDLDPEEPDGSDGPPPADGASIVDLGARRHAQRAARTDSPSSSDEHPSNGEGSRPDVATTSPDEPLEEGAAAADQHTGSATAGQEQEAATSDGAASPQADAPADPAAADTSESSGGATNGPAKARGRRPARKGRAQVPSWDEIVFGGARPSS